MLKTRKLLISRDAKNAENGGNCAQLERIWNAGVHELCPKVPQLDAAALTGNDPILAMIQPPQELACRIKDPVEQQAEKQQGG